jgi:hypothetical protein
MPLNPQDIAAAGDAYLKKLIEDEKIRAEHAAAKTRAEVAHRVAAATGMNVTESDVEAIAEYLNSKRSAEVENLAMQYPSLGTVIEESD